MNTFARFCCAVAGLGLAAFHGAGFAADAVGVSSAVGTSAAASPVTQTPAAPECLAPARLRNDMTPIDLDRVLAACVSLNQMDNAALAFMLGGAYGYFDGLRVADSSAHQAPKVMLMYTLGSLPNDKRQEFEKHLKAVMNDPQQKEKICTSVQSFGPPTYHPKYMIDHGMDATQAAQSGATLPNRGLVDPFDTANAWRTAVKAYLLCEAP